MNVALVFIGGGLGASLRWYITTNISSEGFPYGTLTVNLVGCLLIGIASVFLFKEPKLALLLITGFLGGFTTFSSFGLDALSLLREASYRKFLTYVLSSNVLGILFVVLGNKIGSQFI